MPNSFAYPDEFYMLVNTIVNIIMLADGKIDNCVDKAHVSHSLRCSFKQTPVVLRKNPRTILS